MTELDSCPICYASAKGAPVLHKRTSDRLVRCPGCATVFATPQPSEDELQELYRRQYYNEENTRVNADRKEEERVARVLHRTVLCDLLRRFPQLKRRTGKTPRVLDYGCGLGYFLAECREAGFACTGVEFSALAAKFAGERFDVRVHTDPERALRKLPEGHFDLVTTWQVLEHTCDPHAVVKGLARLLAPKGVFCTAVPSLKCWQYRLQKERWFNVRNPTHLFFFSRKGIERLLRDAELTRIQRPVFWGGRAELGFVGLAAQYAARMMGLGSELRLYAVKK